MVKNRSIIAIENLKKKFPELDLGNPIYPDNDWDELDKRFERYKKIEESLKNDKNRE